MVKTRLHLHFAVVISGHIIDNANQQIWMTAIAMRKDRAIPNFRRVNLALLGVGVDPEPLCAELGISAQGIHAETRAEFQRQSKLGFTRLVSRDGAQGK